MRVAVSVNEDEMIASHLGRCRTFYVFNKEEQDIKFVEMRSASGEGKEHFIPALQDCSVIISGQIGEGMIQGLAEAGIKAVVERTTTDPLEAVKRL